MGRTATGYATWNPKKSLWVARVTLPDGRRSSTDLRDADGNDLVPPCAVQPAAPDRKCTCPPCAQARRVAKLVSDRRRALAVESENQSVETATAWFARYVALHAKLGNGTDQHAGDWARYVAPTIGTKCMHEITPDDVKKIRDELTHARLDGKMKAKRAINVWSTVVKAPFSRAWTDDDPKYSTVRVGSFDKNPATGIKPPVSVADRREDERERQALEPAEAQALLDCSAVPAEARRFYAFCMLSGLRPAELYGLLWSDVRERVIKVQRSRDMKTAVDGSTKTRASVRDVPIHPHLAPLIDAMRPNHKGDLDDCRVFPVADEDVRDVEGHAGELRAHLLLAGVKRDELHKGTPTLRAFDVRSFRTCFGTWCARSGFDSTWIDAWLGHAPKTMAAKHYVKDTGTLGAGVFPTVPKDLLDSGFKNAFRILPVNDFNDLLCEGRDLNPYRSYPTGT